MQRTWRQTNEKRRVLNQVKIKKTKEKQVENRGTWTERANHVKAFFAGVSGTAFSLFLSWRFVSIVTPPLKLTNLAQLFWDAQWQAASNMSWSRSRPQEVYSCPRRRESWSEMNGQHMWWVKWWKWVLWKVFEATERNYGEPEKLKKSWYRWSSLFNYEGLHVIFYLWRRLEKQWEPNMNRLEFGRRCG